MKKAMALFMCLILAASALCSACGSDNTDNASGGSSQSENVSVDNTVQSVYVDENGVYQLANMPEYKFTKKEFVVCVLSSEGHTTYFNEDIDPDLYDTTDQAIKDGLRERNNLIEEKFGVKVKAVAVKSVKDEVKLDIESNSHEYDAAMPYMCDAAKMAQDGQLYELSAFSSIMHLDAPWYDQMAISAGSVADQLYFVTGDISIMPKIVTFGITFNKDMMKNYFPDVDLYKKVEAKEWTYDYMIQLSKAVTQDIDGDTGSMTFDDQWGLSSSNQDAVTYYLASGEALCTKDSSDHPKLALGVGTRSTTVAMNVLETLQDTGTWAIRVEEMGEDPWQKSLDIFANGRTLFRTTAFSAIKKLRNYTNGCNFGIIPMPLMDETQEEYYSPSNPQFANVICIPKSVEDPEFSAYMIEAMSCYGKNYVTPEYYETTLKSRDARDAESEVMLDNYVFKNIVYDVGRIYNFSSLGTVLSDIMRDGNTALASKMESISDSIENEIEECIANYIN